MDELREVYLSIGFIPDQEYGDLFTHPKLPFYVYHDGDNFVCDVNMEYQIARIPFSKENLINLIKAFNPI